MKNMAISFILWYLKLFAKLSLKINKPKVIGIAGSVGKSSTRNALYATLKDYIETKMAWGNSETGVPLGILGIKMNGFSKTEWLTALLKVPFAIFYLKGTKVLIVEMGIDDPYPPKNMEYLLTILKPDIAVSLNITATHTMQFEKTLKENEKGDKKLFYLLTKIAEEDTKIITKSNCKTGIYNNDDVYIDEELKKFKQVNKNTKLLKFGKDDNNDIYYGEYKINLEGTDFEFFIKGKNKNSSINLHFKNYLLPKEYQELLSTVILISLEVGLTKEQIIKSLTCNFTLPKGRATLLKGINNTLIIDSSYNSSRNAVFAFINLIRELKEITSKKTVFLMGDMRELGEEAKNEHEKVADKIKGVFDYLYFVGPLTKQFVISKLEGKENSIKEIKWFDNSILAGKYLKENLPKNSIILVKGSQNTIFLEEAVKLILENKEDFNKLCRQERHWLETKNKYFLTS